MKYQPRRRALEYEKALVKWWKKNQIFEKSVAKNPESESYVFYDGPPFITGLPHHGTLLSSTVKDAVPRFWTMRGKRVERRWGWDCHGLPAENYVEKQLGITDRRQIGGDTATVAGAISLETYIKKARESMVASSEAWEGTIDRIGRWVDFKGAYRTMNKDYMESVWWAFKQLYDAGKIYEGRKVLMYDTKFATPVSKAEVTMDNDAYQEVTDPSAYVKFKLDGQIPGLEKGGSKSQDANSKNQDTYFLAWTTTPWTLPGNLALAISPQLKYGFYELEEGTLVFAEKLAEKVFKVLELEPVAPTTTVTGKELAGASYQPILEVLAGAKKPHTHTILVGDFVSDIEGTGIVHLAPAYGEDDYALCEAEDVDFIDVLDDNGYYLPEVADKLHALGVRDTDANGIEIWAGNKFIAKILEEQGIVRKIEYVMHEYPFNPRSKQRIMYRAFPSWFFDIQGQKPLMLAENEHINWFPEYLKHGRFAKNIEQAPDWNLSRDRFWATAMPVWKSEEGTIKVIGSYDELYQFSGVKLDDYHRPWVDEIEFDAWVLDGEIVAEGTTNAKKEHFRRIEKVLDCWFESGSMPFAELHYPFENKDKFEKGYPADFIVEYVGQVRAWFYYVHAVNTTLASIGAFGEQAAKDSTPKNAFKNVITTGTLAGNDGRKMSKSLGNFTDPNELMDKYSADSLRFLLLSSPVLSGEDFALLDKDVSDVARKLSMIWNVYDFFATYANVDNWDPATSWAPKTKGFSELKNPLDIWIISRLHQVKGEIITGMEEYNIPKALSGVLPLIDDLSNWFVRRSRRRFWKSEDDGDKAEAYWTLNLVLTKLAVILAPFTPFLSEELYQKMTGSTESVHLLDYPTNVDVDERVLSQMARAREIITEGLSLRMQKSETEQQIKIRQPLAKFTYDGEKLPEFYEQMIADELNVKKVEHGRKMSLDKNITPVLKAEGFSRELIRAVQAARKHADLQVDDRIKLYVDCKVDDKFQDLVSQEVLATEIHFEADKQNYAYDEIAKVGDAQVTISLEKA